MSRSKAMKFLVVIGIYLFIFSANAQYHSNWILPNRDVVVIQLAGNSKNNGFFKGDGSLTFYKDKNLSQEYLKFSKAGIFRENSRIAIIDYHEGRSSYPFIEPVAGILKESTEMKSDPSPVDLEFVFYDTRDYDDGTTILFPIDEKLGENFYRINYKGQNLYVKVPSELEAKVVESNAKARREFLDQHKGLVSSIVPAMTKCISVKDVKCFSKIVSRDYREYTFRLLLGDIKFVTSGEFHKISEFFAKEENLIVASNKDKSKSEVCAYNFYEESLFNENNYDHLSNYYSNYQRKRYGICLTVAPTKIGAFHYDFIVLQNVKEYGETFE